MKIRVKDWDDFQHYKKRNPPWIRLYVKLLNKRAWNELSGDDAKMLMNLWMLASEKEGALPSIEDIAFRLRLTEQQVASSVKRLCGEWLRCDASAVLAANEHAAMPETESEAETLLDKCLTKDSVRL